MCAHCVAYPRASAGLAARQGPPARRWARALIACSDILEPPLVHPPQPVGHMKKRLVSASGREVDEHLPAGRQAAAQRQDMATNRIARLAEQVPEVRPLNHRRVVERLGLGQHPAERDEVAALAGGVPDADPDRSPRGAVECHGEDRRTASTRPETSATALICAVATSTFSTASRRSHFEHTPCVCRLRQWRSLSG